MSSTDELTLSPPLFVESPPPEQSICEQCQAPFEARARTGGKPQRFCSPACRRAFHANVTPTFPTSTPTPPTLADVANSTELHPIPPEEDPPDWKWWGENRETVVLQEQPRTAIYWNANDTVVIRQETPWNDDRDDVVVIVTKGNLRSVINRLIEMDRGD